MTKKPTIQLHYTLENSRSEALVALVGQGRGGRVSCQCCFRAVTTKASDVNAVGSSCFAQTLLKLTFEGFFFFCEVQNVCCVEFNDI